MDKREFLKATAFLMAAPLWSYCKEDLQAPPPAAKRETRPKVVRIGHRGASNWDYKTGPYIDSIDYDITRRLIDEGVQQLAGTSDIKAAWATLIPYSPGQLILIKPNLNNPKIGYNEAIMTSPQVIAATIESLISAGVNKDDIAVYDFTSDPFAAYQKWIEPTGVATHFRRDMGSTWNKISARLNWGAEGLHEDGLITMRQKVVGADNKPISCYIPNLLHEASHLINMPCFKGHQFILQSNALKNHFGTVRFSNFHSYPVTLHGPSIQSHIVDINRHPVIQGKTRVIITDALFGAGLFTRGEHGRIPTKWKTFPSGETPNSVFLSRDPVASESVVADYVIAEQTAHGFEPRQHAYLHDAGEQDLGVHEHRDQDGAYNIIDFKEVQLA